MRSHRAFSGLLFTLLGLGLILTLTDEGAQAADRREVVQQSRRLLGDAHRDYAQGEVDSALAKLDEVLVLDPANPDAHYFIGAIRLDQADTAGATEILTEGVGKSPLSRRLKLLLARVQIAVGDVESAEKLVGEVTALRARDMDALYLQGLIALARGDSTGAVAIWDEALAGAEGEAGP